MTCMAIKEMGAFFIIFLLISSPAMARGYISIAGSSAMYPFLILLSQEFKLQGFGRAPVVESTGTGAGLKAFCNGTGANDPDIAMASRPMGLGEQALCIKNKILPPLELEFGFDGVVLLAGKRGLYEGLSIAHLRLSLSQFQNMPKYWSQIDPFFPNLPISLVGPSTTAGSFETFSEVVFHPKNLAMRGDGVYQEVAGQESVVIQKLMVNPDRLGLISFSFLKKSKHSLKVLALDGVYPSPQTIRSGQYPLSRKLYLYVKQESLQNLDMVRFVKFIYANAMMGPQGLLETYGLVTLSPEARLRQIIKVAPL